MDSGRKRTPSSGGRKSTPGSSRRYRAKYSRTEQRKRRREKLEAMRESSSSPEPTCRSRRRILPQSPTLAETSDNEISALPDSIGHAHAFAADSEPTSQEEVLSEARSATQIVNKTNQPTEKSISSGSSSPNADADDASVEQHSPNAEPEEDSQLEEISPLQQSPGLQSVHSMLAVSSQAGSEDSDASDGQIPDSPEPCHSGSSFDSETSSDESVSNLDPAEASDRFMKEWMSTKASTRCTHATASSFYRTVYKNRKLLHKMGDKWVHYQTGRRHIDKLLPKVVADHYFEDLEEIREFVCSMANFPEKQFGDRSRYKLKKTWTRVTLEDALTQSDQAHGRTYSSAGDVPWKNKSYPPIEIDVSMDGVPLDNSSVDVMEVLSFKRTDCVRVFPLGIHIGYSKEKDTNIMFGRLVEELSALNVTIRFVLADSPQRATLLNMVATNGYWSCIKCQFPGEKNPSNFGGKVVWTDKSIGKKRRVHDEWKEDAAKATRFGSVKGVIGNTALFQLVNDVDKQVPLDTFHVLYLGMAKRMVKNVLQLKKDGRPSAVMREVKAIIDKSLPLLHYPSEFSRFPRAIEVPHYKSSEWRNLVTCGFDTVTQALLRLHQKAYARVWEHFVFLVRGLQLDHNMFTELKQAVNLKEVMARFYKLYVKEFKPGSCPATVHMFYHLLEQRDTGSVTEHSTEVFESFYGLLKQAYQPGTKSMGKQIMENVYNYYNSTSNKHRCKPRLRLRPKGKGRSDNSLVVTQSGYYMIRDRVGPGLYDANKIDTAAYKSVSCPDLPFHKVHVYKEIRVANRLETISSDDVFAKAVRCNDLIMMVPPDALHCSNN